MYFFVCSTVQLLTDELLNAVAQLNHAFHASFNGRIQTRLDHSGVFAVIHIAINDRVAVIFYIRVGGNKSVNFFAEIGEFDILVLSVNVLNRLMKLVGEVRAFDRFAGHFLCAAVHHIVELQRSEHPFRMLNEIAGDRDSVRRLTEMNPVRLDNLRSVALLQEDDDGRDFCTGIFLESVVRKSDCTK